MRISDERLAKVLVYCDSPERQGYPTPLSEFKSIVEDLIEARAALQAAETLLECAVIECARHVKPCDCALCHAIKRYDATRAKTLAETK